MRSAAFITLGCKVNQYETEAIREEVLELGYREVPPTSPADVYVVNTCSVTATSGVKSRKCVLRAARANPAARILVVGCSTPSERRALERIPQVAVLAGNEEKAMVASFLEGGWKPGQPLPDRDRDLLSLKISRYTHRTRAVIKVQDGCNKFCSFCIIPFLRGRSSSRHPEAVVEEVRRLVANGFREVVIAGVDLQDYGADLQPPVRLEQLLAAVAAVPGLARVRLSSVGPRAFTPELLALLSDRLFCPHWHIPLQSGSDAVLKRMRRDYTLAGFRAVVEALRSRFPDPSLATDVIVGHPGETAADFELTLAACREFRFAKVHIFPYSAREGTLAYKLGGHLEAAEIRRRAAVLRELERELELGYKQMFVGRKVEVLVESPLDGAPVDGAVEGAPLEGDGAATAGDGMLGGLTERYVRVLFPCPSPRSRDRFPGTLQPVRITAVEPAVACGQWAGETRLWEASAAPHEVTKARGPAS